MVPPPAIMAADGTARLSATFAVLHAAYGQLTLAA
jgi:hypothetical protein